MTTFIGFSTINRNKKFTLTDFALIRRDLVNAFNIRQGSLPGRPAVGTSLWDMLFENQLEQLQDQVEAEIKRVVSGDPRLALKSLQVYPQENGMLIELDVETVPSTDAQRLALFFDITTNTASYL